MSQDPIIKFTCTDRLNETKSSELQLKIENKNDKKEFNRHLIDNLKLFQTEINTLMTGFVDKEKNALASNQLSNEHLKKLNEKSKSTEADEDSSSDDEIQSNGETESEQNEPISKRNQDSESSELNHCEPAEKKLCTTNI